MIKGPGSSLADLHVMAPSQAHEIQSIKKPKDLVSTTTHASVLNPLTQRVLAASERANQGIGSIGRGIDSLRSWTNTLDIKPAGYDLNAVKKFDPNAPTVFQHIAKVGGTIGGAVGGFFKGIPKTDPTHANWTAAILSGGSKKPEGIVGLSSLTNITDAARAHISEYSQIAGNSLRVGAQHLINGSVGIFDGVKSFVKDDLPSAAKLMASPLTFAWNHGSKLFSSATSKAAAETPKTSASVSNVNFLDVATEAIKSKFTSFSDWVKNLFKPLTNSVSASGANKINADLDENQKSGTIVDSLRAPDNMA